LSFWLLVKKLARAGQPLLVFEFLKSLKVDLGLFGDRKNGFG
jgi:hypothetical protein